MQSVSLRSPPATLSKEQQRLKAQMAASASLQSASASGGGNGDGDYDDADAGNSLSKEEEQERKAAIQARIRKEQAEGPPPDMGKRAVSQPRKREDMLAACRHLQRRLFTSSSDRRMLLLFS